jgi:hypothetical protein
VARANLAGACPDVNDCVVWLGLGHCETFGVQGWLSVVDGAFRCDAHQNVLVQDHRVSLDRGAPLPRMRVRAALERFKRVGILSGTGGDYLIEDPLLVDYLFANGPDRLL